MARVVRGCGGRDLEPHLGLSVCIHKHEITDVYGGRVKTAGRSEDGRSIELYISGEV
jgi:hypothetical protein